MFRHPLQISLALLLAGSLGCQPDKPAADSGSPIAPVAPATDADSGDALQPPTAVDPAVDKGMKIDELERSQRLRTEPVEAPAVPDLPAPNAPSGN